MALSRESGGSILRHYANTDNSVCASWNATDGEYTYALLQYNSNQDIEFGLDIWKGGEKLTNAKGIKLDLISRFPAAREDVPYPSTYNPGVTSIDRSSVPDSEINVYQRDRSRIFKKDLSYSHQLSNGKKKGTGGEGIFTIRNLQGSLQVEEGVGSDKLWLVYVTEVQFGTAFSYTLPYVAKFTYNKTNRSLSLSGWGLPLDFDLHAPAVSDPSTEATFFNGVDGASPFNVNSSHWSLIPSKLIKYDFLGLGRTTFYYKQHKKTLLISSKLDTSADKLYVNIVWQREFRGGKYDLASRSKNITEFTVFDITDNDLLMPESATHFINDARFNFKQPLRSSIEKIGNYVFTADSIFRKTTAESRFYLRVYDVSSGIKTVWKQITYKGLRSAALKKYSNDIILLAANSPSDKRDHLYQLDISDATVAARLASDENLKGPSSILEEVSRFSLIGDLPTFYQAGSKFIEGKEAFAQDQATFSDLNKLLDYLYHINLVVDGTEIHVYQLFHNEFVSVFTTVLCSLTSIGEPKPVKKILAPQTDGFTSSEKVVSSLSFNGSEKFTVGAARRIDDPQIFLATGGASDVDVTWFGDNWNNYKTTLRMSNCSGIYRSATSTNIDLKQPNGNNRSDIIFDGTTKDEGSNYWIKLNQQFSKDTDLTIEYVNPTPDGDKVVNLVANSDWRNNVYANGYDVFGGFTLDIHFKISLDGIYGPDQFTVPSNLDFIMNDCLVKLNLRNEEGSIIATLNNGDGYEINIEPEDPDVQVYWDVGGATKTVNSFFNPTVITGANTIVAPLVYGRSDWESELKRGIGQNTTYSPNVDVGDGDIGKPFWLKYQAKYGNTTNYRGGDHHLSASMTRVTGHQYAPDPDTGLVSISGVGTGLDLIPYMSENEIVSISSPATLRIETNIGHSDSDINDRWRLTETPNEYDVLPYIAEVWYLAVPRNAQNIEWYRQYITRTPNETSVGNKTADTSYPNITSLGANVIINTTRFDRFGVDTGGTSPGFNGGFYVKYTNVDPTIVSLNLTQDLVINESNNYYLLVGVVDEFNQYSMSCISNLSQANGKYTFHVPIAKE